MDKSRQLKETAAWEQTIHKNRWLTRVKIGRSSSSLPANFF